MREGFELGWGIENDLSMDSVVWVFERDAEELHGFQGDAHGLDGVAVDDFFETLAFFRRVSAVVD